MPAQLDALYVKTRPSKALARWFCHLIFQGRPLTTRARWLNGLLTPALRVAMRLPLRRPVEKPIFILGMGRTGSTVLGKVLSMHRDVAFLNEPKLLWHLVYPGEDLIGSYSRGAAAYRLAASEATEPVRDAARRLYALCLALTGARRVLDKYPAMIFRVPFVRAIFPDARLLFLTRDGWDTVRSVVRWSEQHAVVVRGETHDWWGVNRRKWRLLVEQVVRPDPAFAGVCEEIARFTNPADMAAVEWVTAMREGLAWLKRDAEALHRVRFEDLTRAPEATLESLLAFCELPEDAVFLDYARRTLVPVPQRSPIPMHPAIHPLFEETMAALGYNRI